MDLSLIGVIKIIYRREIAAGYENKTPYFQHMDISIQKANGEG